MFHLFTKINNTAILWKNLKHKMLKPVGEWNTGILVTETIS